MCFHKVRSLLMTVLTCRYVKRSKKKKESQSCNYTQHHKTPSHLKRAGVGVCAGVTACRRGGKRRSVLFKLRNTRQSNRGFLTPLILLNTVNVILQVFFKLNQVMRETERQWENTNENKSFIVSINYKRLNAVSIKKISSSY